MAAAQIAHFWTNDKKWLKNDLETLHYNYNNITLQYQDTKTVEGYSKWLQKGTKWPPIDDEISNYNYN